MEKIYSYEQLRLKLESFKDDISKIEFLENYLKWDLHISAEMSAITHESLGGLKIESGEPKGEIFEKAASAWERYWATEEFDKVSKREQRKTLRRAILNYKIAMDIYRKNNEETLFEECRKKSELLVNEMAEHQTPVNFFVTFLAGISFVFSFLFLSQSFTGFAIADVEPSTSFFTGGFLLIAGFALILALYLIREKLAKLI